MTSLPVGGKEVMIVPASKDSDEDVNKEWRIKNRKYEVLARGKNSGHAWNMAHTQQVLIFIIIQSDGSELLSFNF